METIAGDRKIGLPVLVTRWEIGKTVRMQFLHQLATIACHIDSPVEDEDEPACDIQIASYISNKVNPSLSERLQEHHLSFSL